MPFTSAIFILAAFLPTQTPVQDLFFSQPQVNLGEVRSHTVRHHRFDFVNRGTDTIEILAVEPSCGCLAAKLEQRKYQPGDKGSIVLDIKPTTQATGPHAWFTKVIYRAGQRQETAELYLQAVVRHEVSVAPAALVWTGTGTREITVTDLRDPPLTITGLYFTSPLIRAQLVSSEKGVSQINLQASSAIAPGRHDEMLWIYTSDPVYNQLQIPVTLIGQTRSAISVTPAEIRQQIAVGKSIPSTLIRLRPSGERSVVIQSANSDDAAMTCTFAHGPLNEATLKIQVNAAALGNRDLNATVRVHVREPVDEVLIIPCGFRGDDLR